IPIWGIPGDQPPILHSHILDELHEIAFSRTVFRMVSCNRTCQFIASADVFQRQILRRSEVMHCAFRVELNKFMVLRLASSLVADGQAVTATNHLPFALSSLTSSISPGRQVLLNQGS